MTFSDIGLSQACADRLTRAGILEPTPIQQESFAPILAGQPVLGLSKTGTGKTLAFVAPLVERLTRHASSSQASVRGVVMIPTRELAFQVAKTIELIAGPDQPFAIVVGGEAEEAQVRAAQKATWVIATPGRLLDLISREKIQLSETTVVVFDEADRLLDMGFVDDIRKIMSFFPRKIQLLFFSATLHFGVDELAYEFGADCLKLGQEDERPTVEGLDHRLAFVGDQEKLHALVWYLSQRKEGRGIIFSNYREKAHDIAARLQRLGARTACLTAQLNQQQRVRIMDDFRAGRIQTLVASDLAARGLDVFDLDFVLNFDLPEDPASYVHRVGRTARAGKKGEALSFVGFEDSYRLDRLEKFLGQPIPRFQVPVEVLTGPLHSLRGEGASSQVEVSSHRSTGQASGKISPEPKRPVSRPSSQSHSGKSPGSYELPSVRDAALKKARPTQQNQGIWRKLWAQVKALFSGNSKKDSKIVSGRSAGSHTTTASVSRTGARGVRGSPRGGRPANRRSPRR